MLTAPFARPAARPRLACALALAGALSAGPALAATTLPDFAQATFASGAPIDHPYFPLSPGWTATLRAVGADGVEESRLSFGGAGRVILGVQTAVQHDMAFVDGVLVEETFDYFAQDADGNVWYMGEDVTNYLYDADGNLIGTNNSSAWIAGENGALPGFQMPAVLTVGDNFFQEFAPSDEALDEALIWALGLQIVSGGRSFMDVVQIYESSSLDPGLREFKYYAPGVGIIRADEGLSLAYANPELVFELAAVPLPGALPFLAAGLALLAGLNRRGLRRRGPTGSAAGIV